MKVFAILLLALALATPARADLLYRPELSVSRTLLQPGEATTITAVFYSDAPEKHIAELRGSAGWQIDAPERDVFTDGTRGVLVNWRATASAAILPGRYVFTLSVDGVEADRISVDIQARVVWLPWIRKAPAG